MFFLALLACSSPTRLAHVEGATRLTELANGELLVGTATGQLWLVTSFGEARLLTTVGVRRVVELVSDPLGRYWAREEGGEVLTGNAWSSEVHRVGPASVLVRRCDETQLLEMADAGVGVSAISLGPNSCDTLVRGTEDGQVDGQHVTEARIARVQAVGDGVLWVDASMRAGCLGCSTRVPEAGVVDALALHLAPFVAGEVVWIDAGGTLWIAHD